MASGIVINSVQDAIALASKIHETAQQEVVWLVPASIHSLSLHYGFIERAKTFIQNGGVTRGVVCISRKNAAEIEMFLDVGEDIRHSDDVHELLMYIGDKRESISSINIGVSDYTLDTPVTAFWSEDPTYAEYLLTSFENVWSQAVPAEKRIQELLKRG